MTSFDFQPRFTSDVVQLEPLTSVSFDMLQAAALDLATWADYPTQKVRDSGSLSSWFPKGVNAARAILLRDGATGSVAGTTRYYPVPDEPTAIGIGYTFIGAKFRRDGQTNTAVKRIMFAHAFAHFNAVWFHVLPENFRSQAAVKKLGVKHLGQQTLVLTDQPRVYETYRLCKNDWENLDI